MELLIVIVVLAVLVWFFFFRDKEVVKEAMAEAPYKVEAQPEPVVVTEEKVVVPATPAPEPVAIVEQPVKAAKPKRATKPKSEKTTAPRTRKPKMTVAK